MSKKRNLIFICLLILGVFLITSCLPKPPVTEGILKGQVIVPEGTLQAKDLTGQALPDATVNIIDPATGAIIATATTDADGYYQVFVPAGGPYLLQVVKDGVVILQITPQVEVGIEYDLGTADCSTTAVALIALAMMDAGANLADINLDDIAADPNFDDVLSNVTSIIEAGGDPTESAVIEQAVEDFLSPPPPAPAPTPTYTVTFDSQGGSAVSPQTVEEGGKATEPTAPTRTGYTFGGWYKESGCTNAWDFDTDTVTADVTLYAKWTINTYTVTYNGNGSTGGTVPSDANHYEPGETVTVLNNTGNLVKTGYNFDGWNTAADGNGTDQAVGSTFSMGAFDVTLYAKWAAVIDIAEIPGVTAPVTGATPVGTITATAQYTGTVTWSPADDPFQGSTEYTATITLTAKAGFTLTGVAADFFTVSGATATNSINSGVVTAIFPETASAVIDIAAIPGVTAPVIGATPVTAITPTDQYIGTVTWDPADNPFLGEKIYTATITLTAKAGFTLTGVAADFFTVSGATATNSINSGVVTAIFPETVLAVGDSYGGGIVAYILQSGDPGYDANVQHGLIAATADQSTGIAWITGGDTQTTWVNGVEYGGTSTDYGTGQANTNAMKAQIGYTGGAAKVCDDYSVTVGSVTYTDWFLPSKDELYKLYLSKTIIGGFDVGGYYWSSSEDVLYAYSAWVQFFGLYGTQTGGFKSGTHRVRAVRAF